MMNYLIARITACLLSASAIHAMASDEIPAPLDFDRIAQCHATGAQYALMPDSRYRIVLETAPEPSAASNLQLRLLTPGTQHAFAFAVSNGYSITRLLPLASHPSADPENDTEGDEETLPVFHAFDADMTTWIDAPQAEGKPPAWLFIPELGPMLWYGLLPREGTSMPASESMPAGLFQLVACTP